MLDVVDKALKARELKLHAARIGVDDGLLEVQRLVDEVEVRLVYLEVENADVGAERVDPHQDVDVEQKEEELDGDVRQHQKQHADEQARQRVVLDQVTDDDPEDAGSRRAAAHRVVDDDVLSVDVERRLAGVMRPLAVRLRHVVAAAAAALESRVEKTPAFVEIRWRRTTPVVVEFREGENVCGRRVVRVAGDGQRRRTLRKDDDVGGVELQSRRRRRAPGRNPATADDQVAASETGEVDEDATDAVQQDDGVQRHEDDPQDVEVGAGDELREVERRRRRRRRVPEKERLVASQVRGDHEVRRVETIEGDVQTGNALAAESRNAGKDSFYRKDGHRRKSVL